MIKIRDGEAVIVDFVVLPNGLLRIVAVKAAKLGLVAVNFVWEKLVFFGDRKSFWAEMPTQPPKTLALCHA